MPSRETRSRRRCSYSRWRRQLPPRHNEAAVAAVLAAAAAVQEAFILAAIILAVADRTTTPTVDRTLMGRMAISADRMVISSSEVVSTTHSGGRSTRMAMDIGTGMDIRMGIRTGRTTIRRT